MTRPTTARAAGDALLWVGSCSLLLLACDAPAPESRSAMVPLEASTQDVDDVSLDREELRAHVVDDDPRGVDSHAHGPDFALEDIPGLRWSDPRRGTLVVPSAEAGEWTLEVRAHAGDHEARWIQGPFDADEVADTEIRLAPPEEALDADAPGRTLRVMSRLVLRDAEGAQLTQLALPALVMQARDGRVRFAIHDTLPVKIHGEGKHALADADLPERI